MAFAIRNGAGADEHPGDGLAAEPRRPDLRVFGVAQVLNGHPNARLDIGYLIYRPVYQCPGGGQEHLVVGQQRAALLQELLEPAAFGEQEVEQDRVAERLFHRFFAQVTAGARSSARAMSWVTRAPWCRK